MQIPSVCVWVRVCLYFDQNSGRQRQPECISRPHRWLEGLQLWLEPIIALMQPAEVHRAQKAVGPNAPATTRRTEVTQGATGRHDTLRRRRGALHRDHRRVDLADPFPSIHWILSYWRENCTFSQPIAFPNFLAVFTQVFLYILAYLS